ncbi:TonB-dependent receptor plug domain-containing protein [Dokdonella fugitiva]|uniref:TonB-dependent receptor-like protein n=1 Tax=Dokdonella fugitiva TaxID=328517 RepID=A0A4R2I2T1_9GAMM|nr:TonB-dependent receptor [Dokdonella fugitiva]MBA8885484.1 outer membrane receptor protein involved in Fe transport [Dokdonella fugitiva]TCO38344.1 TonB-dependent receptor-like protein [Dokdonella fugitiva]
MRHMQLRQAIRRALVVMPGYARPFGVASLAAAAGLGAMATAHAQSADDSQKLETITVTGSNIRRVDIETSNPVVTIDRAAIEKTGKLTLGDLVQQLPAVTGPNTNPQVNNSGGTGFSSIGLRGLGSPRTLVLINGHRYLSGDPNAIPANMIERIEVLTDGASSVYGSDAIAGVVNFILRSDYQGAEFSADYGISDRDDGASKGYSFTFGQSSDKGSIMAGVNYKKIDGVLSGHREFSKNAVSRLGSTSSPIGTFVGGSSSSPFGHVQIPAGMADLFPGCSSGFLARNPGASGLNVATDYHCYRNNAGPDGPSDKYNYATVNLVMTPQERSGLFLNGNYKLTDSIDAYLSVMHNKTSASFQLAPAVYGTPYGTVISADSYYNPFGVDFAPGANSFTARLSSLGNRRASNGTANDQLSTGFKGSFSIWNDQQWNWELGFDYGHVHLSTTTYGLPNMTVLNQATGPSFLGDDGVVHCGTGPDDIIDGCTPFNPFNLDDPNSIAVLRAAASPGVNNFMTKETVKRLDLNGGLFDLPAGAMQLAVGYNYRTEYTHSNVDTGLIVDFNGNCTLGSQCGSALQGGYNVKEAYAELFVPIVKDLPFLHALNLTVGDRWSKYSTFGSTNNTKIALEYRPIEDLLLRGTMSKVFRAPTVANIFGGAGSDAPKISRDPCDGYTGGGNPACVNVPTDGSFRNQNVAQALQLNAILSGAAYAGFPIGPEKGKSFDFGIVYDPHWLEGLSVSADLWRLYLNDNITTVRAQSVIDLCAAGQTAYCPLIRRYASGPNQGQIQTLIEPTGNLGRVDVGGVDFALNYRLPEFSFGRFNVGVNATYLKNYDLQTAPGLEGGSTYHYAGHFMNYGSAQAGACPGAGGGVCLFPRWRAQSSVGWQMGPFDASWAMRYIHRFRMGSASPSQDTHPYGTGNPSLDGLYTDYGSTVYHDIQFGYNLESLNTRFDIGVNNVGDKQPPFLYANNTLNANTDPSDFDLLGRYYWGRITVKF